VLEELAPGQRLAVDANGRFDTEKAIAYAEAQAHYDLFWYEEAGDPLDYALQFELAKHYPGSVSDWRKSFLLAGRA
jgi:L-alanine-DL-glutamate epimerase-like enolase superfamily enzyme